MPWLVCFLGLQMFLYVFANTLPGEEHVNLTCSIIFLCSGGNISSPLRYSYLGITKACTQLHPAPSTSTSSTQPPPSSFQSPPSFLQHLQQYLNQNIARNWSISPNLVQKIKSCPFWLKICTRGILEVLIPNPDSIFWNFDPKIHFWANLGPKSQRCPFCLKIGTHGISRMLILIQTLVFWISNFKFLFGQIWAKKVKVVCFV